MKLIQKITGGRAHLHDFTYLDGRGEPSTEAEYRSGAFYVTRRCRHAGCLEMGHNVGYTGAEA